MVAGVRVASLIKGSELRPITADEYMHMARAGILDEDERVELLDGVIVAMSPIDPPHSFAVYEGAHAFTRGLPDGYIVRVQDSVRLSVRSMPQPDIAVVRALGDVYAHRHPEPAEIFLIVEVSGSSLSCDRRLKVPLYAAAGIREVWIVDLRHRQVIVYRDPQGASYAEVTTYVPGEPITPLAYPELRLDPAALFPRER